MEDHFKILTLASNNQLPEQIDEHFEYPIDVVTELIEGGLLKAIDASSFDGIAYLQTKITIQGREYLQNLSHKIKPEPKEMLESNLKLFISHSSKDKVFVEILLRLLRASLNLSAREIRCTSVDGYRLPAGANTNEQLKEEVHTSQSFIGVISNKSIRSMYVVFELGARWGANKPLIPLVAPSTSISVLEGPLTGINALSASSREQLHQLLENVASELSTTLEPIASYSPIIEEILALQPEEDESESSVTPNSVLIADNYELVETAGGAVVYKSVEGLEHFACPNCYPDQIKILQDRRVVSGHFDCPHCNAAFPIKPNTAKRRVLHKGIRY